MIMDGDPLLTVRHLKKYFPIRRGLRRKEVARIHALDGVSFDIWEGETLGLVGESGCGKTTLARCIVRLLEPTGGELVFRNQDITHLNMRALRPLRREFQIVFQDPFESLNPRKSVGSIVGDSLKILKQGNTHERKQQVCELLAKVGLSRNYYSRYPGDFSGGQRQRVGIARALAVQPRLIVADEPVSALDVSIQAQILNLLKDLQDELQLTYLFIAHDLGVIRHVSDRIGVMYLGKLVELAPAEELYRRPIHPYTEALISAIPVPDPDAKIERKRIILEGDVPSPITRPRGCHFHPRCSYASDICRQEEPPLLGLGGGRFAACHNPLTGLCPAKENRSPKPGTHQDQAAR